MRYPYVGHIDDTFEELLKRYAKLYKGSKYYYWLRTQRHYASPLPLGEKFKEKDYYFPHNNLVKRGKPFRTPEKPGFEIDRNVFATHLIYENRNFYLEESVRNIPESKYYVKPSDRTPNFYLVYPPHQDWECSWGALDVDTYNDPDLLKKIVKQIYDEKLPLIPVFSKSKGLHLYLFSTAKVSVPQMRGALAHLRDVLGLHKKTELFPKQKKREYEKNYPTLEKVGNGIGLPYGSCWVSNKKSYDHYQKVQKEITETGESIWAEKRDPGELHEGYETVYPEWIKNDQLETGNLEEFLDYAEAHIQEAEYFEQFPLLNMKEDLPEAEKNSNSNAIPLSEPLQKILNNIKEKKDHDRGGTFDNHIVDFVHGAVQDSRTDIEIAEHISNAWQYADKDNNTYQDKTLEEYIKTRIDNNRAHSGKEDPSIKRKKFMEDHAWLMDIEKFKARGSKTTYGQTGLDIKYSHIFPKGVSASNHFKKDPNKQIAEGTLYRPANYDPNSPIMTDSDGLKYFNTFEPGPLTPRKFEHRKEIEKFFKLMEYLIPNEKHRELVLDWLACIVQKPGIKLRYCVVIVSRDWQTGKGSLFRCMEMVLGKNNTQKTKIKAMKDKGAMFTDKQFVLIDECAEKGDHTAKRDLVNELKPIISENTIMVRRMRVDFTEVENNPSIIVFSNEEDALAVGHKDARYFIIFHREDRLPQKFYDDFHDWLEGPDKKAKLGKGGGAELIYYYLKHRDISKFNPMAPAPDTEAKEEMAEGDDHPLTKKIKEWLEAGVYPFRFGSDVVSTLDLSKWIENNCKGQIVKWGTDFKTLKQCLKQAGGVYIKPTMHKQRNEKITIVILRNHKRFESMKAIDIVNNEWKPLAPHMTSDEAVHDHITNEMNKPTQETIDATEKVLNDLKEKKRRNEIPDLDRDYGYHDDSENDFR